MKRVEYQVMYDIEDDFWWYAGMRRATASILNRFVLGGVDPRFTVPLRILDAGSGTGKNLEFFARYGAVVGVEIAAEGIRLTRQRGAPRLIRASVSNLPFARSSFDLATSFEVIYHLGVADDGAALAELARVVRPGGHVLVRVPAYDWLRGSHDRAVQTRHRYTVGELQRKMKAAGLDVIHTSYLNSALFPIAAAKRAAESLLPATGESDLKPLHPVLNTLFTNALALEGAIASWTALPFGLSALCVARKR